MTTNAAAPSETTQSHPTDPALLVVLELYEAIDTGRARSAVGLFTEDGVFEGPTGLLEGQDAIAEFMDKREDNKERHTIHTLSNVENCPLDDGGALVRGIVMVYASDTEGAWQLERVSRVRHVLRAVDNQFRIAQRLREPLEVTAAGGAS